MVILIIYKFKHEIIIIDNIRYDRYLQTMQNI